MKTVTSTWFECKVRLDKVMDDGLKKKVTETYVVDALSFTEAEKRITNEMAVYTSGEFFVTGEKIAVYHDIVFTECVSDDKWYKVKTQVITLNEKTNREQRMSLYLLVQAKDVESARKTTDVYFKDSMCDHVIVSMVETPIMDVYKDIEI